MDNKQLTGLRIRDQRKIRSWTQEDLIEHARRYAPKGKRLVKESISRAERGVTNLDVWVVNALAQALEVSSDYLLGATDDPSINGETPFPVPHPDLWEIVGVLNELRPDQRQGVVQIIRNTLMLMGVSSSQSATPAARVSRAAELDNLASRPIRGTTLDIFAESDLHQSDFVAQNSQIDNANSQLENGPVPGEAENGRR